MIYSYMRVSTKEQNLDRQHEGIKDYCNSNTINFNDVVIFQDKQSGKDLERPQYKALRKVIKPGDTLIIKELDRLGRNKEDIKNELDYYRALKVKVKILNIPTTLIDLPKGQDWVFDMINNIMIEVLGAIAEEERKKIRMRQKEGIIIAQNKGVKFGREKVTKDNLPKEFEKVYRRLISKSSKGTLTNEEGAKILKISRMTLFRWIKIYEGEV
ncbi:MAG: recombinase family protein [Terrisporobacter sp.]